MIGMDRLLTSLDVPKKPSTGELSTSPDRKWLPELSLRKIAPVRNPVFDQTTSIATKLPSLHDASRKAFSLLLPRSQVIDECVNSKLATFAGQSACTVGTARSEATSTTSYEVLEKRPYLEVDINGLFVYRTALESGCREWLNRL
ncbi:cytochrome p450 [Moniliophthora roreri]|nr:cytochrome p450 [Moniliophthora roreri]